MVDIYHPTTPAVTAETRVDPERPHELLFGDAEMSDDTEEADMALSRPDHMPDKETSSNE